MTHPLLVALLLALPMPAAAAQPDTYPLRPLRLIVPFPPGGGNDILARAVAQRLTDRVLQQVIVDNRGGGGGAIGGTLAAGSAPDGYTLFLGSLGGLAHNPALRPNLPYDPVRDFAPLILLVRSPFILVVHPGIAATSVKELIALARAKPGALNMGSAGAGSSLHMTGELFKHTLGINMVHVGYKGTAQAITDLIAGQVHVVFSTPPPAVPMAKSGKLRALAVTSARRSAALPDVPTVIEAGVAGFEVDNWQGLVVPARTPQPIVARLHRELQAVLALPGMAESLATQGLDAAGGTPESFGALIRSEVEKYRRLVLAAKISVD